MALTALDTVAVTAFLAVSLSIFGRKMYLRLRYLFTAQRKERRWGSLPHGIEADLVVDREHFDLQFRSRVLVADVVVDARRPPVLVLGLRAALEAHPHHLRNREHVLHGPDPKGRVEDRGSGEDRDVRCESSRATLMAAAPRWIRVHGVRTLHGCVPGERDWQAARPDANHHEHPGYAERPGRRERGRARRGHAGHVTDRQFG